MSQIAIRFDAGALEDFETARDWYWHRDPATALRFAEQLAASLEKIAQAPRRWPLLQSIPRRLAVRVYLMPSFPFRLPYQVIGDAVVVLAVAHTHRRPGYWARRVLTK